jgi:hypothetical protein
LEKRKYFLKRSELQKNPDWFPCPKEKCKGGGIKEKKNYSVSCSECEYQFCCNCGKNYSHEGECSTNVLDQDGDSKEIKEEVKKCPSCKVPIYKYIGCDHIICKNCEYEFCFLCEQTYYNGHLRDCHSGPTVNIRNCVVPIEARPVPKFEIKVEPNSIQKLGEKVVPNPIIKVAAWALYNQHIDTSVVYANNPQSNVLKTFLSMTQEAIKITQNSLTLLNLKLNSLEEIKKENPEFRLDAKLKFRFYVAKQVMYSKEFSVTN